MPTTLREEVSLIVLFRSSEAVASSGTALKPRLLAAARSLSRSRPASATSDFAASPLIQPCAGRRGAGSLDAGRSEEHTSDLQSLMRILYAVLCLKKIKK